MSTDIPTVTADDGISCSLFIRIHPADRIGERTGRKRPRRFRDVFHRPFCTGEAPEGFVLIEGGSFQMGSPDSEPWRSEDETQHTVTVSDFYISPYELTQAEYEAAMGENPSNFSGEDLPVENISCLYHASAGKQWTGNRAIDI